MGAEKDPFLHSRWKNISTLTLEMFCVPSVAATIRLRAEITAAKCVANNQLICSSKHLFSSRQSYSNAKTITGAKLWTHFHPCTFRKYSGVDQNVTHCIQGPEIDPSPKESSYFFSRGALTQFDRVISRKNCPNKLAANVPNLWDRKPLFKLFAAVKCCVNDHLSM